MEFESLVRRIDSLEKQNRFFKTTGVAALFVLSAILLLGQDAARRTVEAEKFVLLDSGGVERARLEVTNGFPRFAMYGPDHELRVRLESTNDGSQIVFHSFQSGGTVLAPVFLGVGERGDEETGFLSLAAHDAGESILPRSTKTYFIVEPRENVRGLRFYDSNGEGTLSMSTSEQGLQLKLADKSGNITWSTQ